MNYKTGVRRQDSMIKRLLHALLLATSAGLLGCATPPAGPLFQQLGGTQAVDQVIGRTLERAASDPRTQRSFEGIKLASVRQSLVQQICALSGGGCTYEGETMARSHKDARIQASEFDALVDMLREELDRAGVEAGAKNALLRLLAPMKRDIVTAT